MKWSRGLIFGVVLALAGGGVGTLVAQGKPRSALIAEAERASARENWDEAVRKYQEAFAQAPGTAEEYARVGDILLWSGRAVDAVEMVTEGRRHHPENGELGIQLGLCLQAAEAYEPSYRLLVELEGKFRGRNEGLLDDTFYFYLGAAAERSGRMGEAERHFRKSMDLALGGATADRAARSANYLAFLWLEQDRDLEKALELIQQANEWAPGEAAYVDSLGWAFFKLGRYPEALVELLRAEKLAGGSPDGDNLDHIAQTYFRLGHREEALRYLDRAVTQAPGEKVYEQRREEFRSAKTGAVVPLDFLKSEGGEGSGPGRRRGGRLGLP